jgi:preprotein translocase subunit SecD
MILNFKRGNILINIIVLLFFSCVKHSLVRNAFVDYLIENKNNNLLYLVNEEATNELNKIYRENIDLVGSFIIADNNKLFDLHEGDNNLEEIFSRYLILEDKAIQIGMYISKIKAKKDEMGFIITCDLDTEGRKIFYEFTSNNIGREIAMVLNNKLIFYATILRPLENSINFLISNDEIFID